MLFRCLKNQHKLCDSLGARVQVTMGNNHKQVFAYLVAFCCVRSAWLAVLVQFVHARIEPKPVGSNCYV